MRKTIVRTITPLVALLCGGVIVFSGVQPVAAQQSGGIGGRVANPNKDNPRSQSIFIHTIKRGESKKDQLLVVNQTDSKKTISLGSVDGVVTNTGAYTCRQAAEPVKDSGKWVKLAKNKVTLPAHGETRVDFTITVPEKADVGEHNSCLTLQADDPSSKAESGVRLRMRQAIRMVVTIPGKLNRQISIEQFSATNSGGEQHYDLTAANKGNVSADVNMQISLTSLFGRELASVGGEYPVIPDQKLSQNFVTKQRPLFGGWYYVTPSLKYDTRLGVFGTQGDAKYETKTGEKVLLFFWPTVSGMLLIISLIAIGAGLAWFWMSRRSHRAQLEKSTRRYTVREGDTVQSLAEKLQVNWKDIVRINKLTAPYVIKPGDSLRLPTMNVLEQKDAKKG